MLALTTVVAAAVTINTYANITNAMEADEKCVGEANGRLTGKFVAWFPDGTKAAIDRLVNPRTNQPLNGAWFRIDDKRIVKARLDLGRAAMVPLENSLSVDAARNLQTGAAWTGTLANGTKGVTCPNPNPTIGTVTAKDETWTDEVAFAASCAATSFHLYCFQVD